MNIFYREAYDQAVITIQSNEIIGSFDSSFVEDYYGIEGQLSLMRSSGLRSPLLVSWVDTDHTAIRAWIPLNTIANGVYELQGRVRDVVGNYTVFSDYFDMSASAQIYPLVFEVRSGAQYVPPYFDPVMSIEGQYDNAFKLPTTYSKLILNNYVAVERLWLPRSN